MLMPNDSLLAMSCVLLIAGTHVVGCKEHQADSPGSSSCDAAAEHLIAICDPITGEEFRALCEIEDIPLVTAATRTCVAKTRECSEAALESCDVRNVTIACTGDDDCPGPFMCNLGDEECVRCMSDQDCGSGRGCLMGTCFDAESEFYRTLREVFQGDAGTGSN